MIPTDTLCFNFPVEERKNLYQFDVISIDSVQMTSIALEGSSFWKDVLAKSLENNTHPYNRLVSNYHFNFHKNRINGVSSLIKFIHRTPGYLSKIYQKYKYYLWRVLSAEQFYDVEADKLIQDLEKILKKIKKTPDYKKKLLGIYNYCSSHECTDNPNAKIVFSNFFPTINFELWSDDWLFTFWIRRHKEGNLPLVELEIDETKKYYSKYKGKQKKVLQSKSLLINGRGELPKNTESYYLDVTSNQSEIAKNNHEPLLIQAVVRDDYQLVKELIIRGINSLRYEKSALNIALKNKFYEIADLLIENNIHLSIPDIHGLISIHYAIKYGNINLLNQILQKNTIVIQKHHLAGLTELAIERGDVKTIQTLLSNGVHFTLPIIQRQGIKLEIGIFLDEYYHDLLQKKDSINSLYFKSASRGDTLVAG